MSRGLLLMTVLLLLGVYFEGSPVAANPQRRSAPGCELSDFSVWLGPRISEATGQGTLDLRLTNTAGACVLDGYPRISFYDALGVIPFRIRDRGDQMITSGSPRPVLVRRYGTAFVALNKYRCDFGDRRTPKRLRIASGALRASAISVSLSAAPRDMSWCGRNDPGSTIDVTPFEPTRRALGR